MNNPPVDSSAGPAVTSKSTAKSAKERMREYRQRLRQDKEAYEAVKKKDRESKKAAYTPVAELSGRAHRTVKKKWKEGKRKRRAAKQETETQATQTPLTTEIQRTPKSSTQTFELSRQKVQSLLKKEQEREDLVLEIEVLKNKVKSEEKKVEMYKKRCSRLSGGKSVDTPQKKMSKVLKEKKEHRCDRSKGVKRQLIYHFALLKQLKCLNKEKKKTLASVCHGEILRKYKLTTVFRNDIGLFGKKNTAKKKTEHPFAQRIRDFFLRIDVSKIVVGKKNVVRKCKLVKQRRNLTDTLTNLFLKFKSENPGCKVSFATFWRYKPFWVGQPHKNDRDTCQCKYCENMKCFACAMYKLGAIQTSRVNVLVHQKVCSVNNKKCMFSDCPECEHKALPKVLHVNPDEPCSWNEWKTVTEERELKSGIKKKITLTKRVNESGVFADLEKLFYSELSKFKKHFFIMKTQYDHYSHVKSNLSQREVLIHVDFAENYVGKYNNQLQSVHFGASQPQISLHTGYFQTSSVLKSFCGISDSMEHSPESIWAYLTPVLTKIRSEYPFITTIHFFSDGPTQQYRQKKNFYLFCTEIFKRGFQLGYWNFFAPGHGKGIPDGVGAAMKRQADLRVKCGGNIMSSKEFISELSKSESKVMLYEVKEKSFCTVPVDACKPVKDTMSLQQILCHKKGSLLYRETSCTCSPASPHKDHGFKSHSFEKAKTSSLGSTVNFEDIEADCSDGSFFNAPELNDLSEHSATMTSLCDISDGSIFKKLLNCKSFAELYHECESLFLKDLYGSKRSVVGSKLPVDVVARKLLPKDLALHTKKSHFPVRVRADGNCLPACGAVFAFGKDVKPELMRLHIVHELVIHHEYYLCEENLLKGYGHPSKPLELLKSFAMYSDFFLPGQNLSFESIKDLYKREVKAICENKSFMGIWQMFALSSVLKMPIRSVYPDKGNPIVRKHLNRRIVPRVQVSECEALIMWTSTRNHVSSMSDLYWIPNHFVPVLQFSHC